MQCYIEILDALADVQEHVVDFLNLQKLEQKLRQFVLPGHTETRKLLIRQKLVLPNICLDSRVPMKHIDFVFPSNLLKKHSYI